MMAWFVAIVIPYLWIISLFFYPLVCLSYRACCNLITISAVLFYLWLQRYRVQFKLAYIIYILPITSNIRSSSPIFHLYLVMINFIKHFLPKYFLIRHTNLPQLILIQHSLNHPPNYLNTTGTFNQKGMIRPGSENTGHIFNNIDQCTT
jgi:hypothetical protein